jgi:hypothetical protein
MKKLRLTYKPYLMGTKVYEDVEENIERLIWGVLKPLERLVTPFKIFVVSTEHVDWGIVRVLV